MANPLKVLTDLHISGSTGRASVIEGAISGSGALSVGSSATIANGLTVSAGSVTLPTASVANAALQGSGKVTVGSTEIALGANSTSLGGLTGLSGSNLVISGSQISASAGFSGNGAGLTSLSASQLQNFTNDVRAQVSAGTGVTISSGQISIGQEVATDSNVTFNDVTVAGNLTVNGTTTTVDTANLLVEDAVIQIGSGSAGNADGDRGLIFSRASENKAFFWDESDSKFKLAATTTAGTTNTIVAGTAQALDVGALSATSVTASSGLLVQGSSTLSGAVLIKTDSDFGDGAPSYLNLTGALFGINEQLNSLESSGLSKATYSGVRSYSYAAKGAGSSVQFLLSGSSYTGNGSAAVTASCPTKLSGSSSGAVLSALRFASFDVATKDQDATIWTNDLVSVQFAVTQPGGSGLYFPLVTVDAPALASGAEIRLIVVNEATEEFI